MSVASPTCSCNATQAESRRREIREPAGPIRPYSAICNLFSADWKQAWTFVCKAKKTLWVVRQPGMIAWGRAWAHAREDKTCPARLHCAWLFRNRWTDRWLGIINPQASFWFKLFTNIVFKMSLAKFEARHSIVWKVILCSSCRWPGVYKKENH